MLVVAMMEVIFLQPIFLQRDWLFRFERWLPQIELPQISSFVLLEWAILCDLGCPSHFKISRRIHFEPRYVQNWKTGREGMALYIP